MIELCVGAVIHDSGKILLIRSGKWDGKYVIPGGHVEVGETLNQALHRDIKEETGLEIKEEWLFSARTLTIDSRNYLFLTYSADAKTQDVKPDGKETESFLWLTPAEALEGSDVYPKTKETLRELLRMQPQHEFDLLKEIEHRLRSECPWDRKQTLATMLPDLEEEVGELKEAIAEEDLPHIEEEMGDVFQNLMLMAAIARERGLDLSRVLRSVRMKMIRRHPHVFGDLRGKGLSAEEVTQNWKDIKDKERAGK